MKKQFKASVNGKFDFLLTEGDAMSFHRQSNERIPAHEDEQSVRAQLFAGDFLNRNYTLRINGGFYYVNLQNELDLLIEELGLAADVSSRQNELKAPMPGLITEVLVAAGAAVKAGDGLLVLEAMKMENKLTASHDAVIKDIIVKAGDAVEKGSVLIAFENDEENI